MTRGEVLEELVKDAEGIVGEEYIEYRTAVERALTSLAQIEESERLTEEEIEKIMIDFWSDRHSQPCFMDMEKITELARAITQAQVKKGKG